MAAKQEELWARMVEEVVATFWEVFSETSSIDLVRLLPWCISSATNPDNLPTYYMSESLATNMQQRVEAPTATTTPESGGPQALDSMSSPVGQTETLPLPILPLSNIPLISTPSVGHSLVRLFIDPQHTKQDCSPMVPLMINLVRGLMPKLPKPKSAVGTAHHRVTENCLKHQQRHTPMVWVPLGVLKSTTVRTTLIMVVTIQAKMNLGRMQPIVIWNQPQRIVSLVQIWRQWPSELHEWDSIRGCGPPLALWGAAFGLRPN